jgi:hypothetical protein
MIYGFIFKTDTIVVEVTAKDIYTTVDCSMNQTTKVTTCHTNTHYRISTTSGTFHTTSSLYNIIIVGKKHVFYVRGWDFLDRYITKVVE